MNEIDNGGARFDPPKDTPFERANYVVQRLAEAAVDGPTDADWAQIRSKLGRAYWEILVAQKWRRLRVVLRWVVGITVAYAAAAVSQWQIDLLWGANGFSARVLYMPVLMLIAVPPYFSLC